MSLIQRVEVWRYNGVDYSTREKAIEAWENDVNLFVRHKLCSAGLFGPKEQNIVTELLIKNRGEAVSLLNLGIRSDEES